MKLLELLTRLPWMGKQAKRIAVDYAVPFNRALGIRIVSVAEDSSSVILRLPPRGRNRNVAGTVHGGATLALAETVHGVALLWQFSPSEHLMFTKRAALEFLSPARGELRVSFGLDSTTRASVESALRSSGRCELSLTCTVTDRPGEPVAELDATYVIRRRR